MTPDGQVNITGLSTGDAWTALLDAPNLQVLTDGEYRQDFVERLVDELTARVLYGPFAPTFDRRFELRRVRAAQMTAEARATLEHGNAVRSFGPTQPSSGT